MRRILVAVDGSDGALRALDVAAAQARLTPEGEVATVIADRAADLGCEAIVMGSHGRGQLGAFVLGSVAQRVVHRATVPVPLVK